MVNFSVLNTKKHIIRKFSTSTFTIRMTLAFFKLRKKYMALKYYLQYLVYS